MQNGVTAMHVACKEGRLDMVKILHAQGASIESASEVRTCQHHCVQCRSALMYIVLCRKDALLSCMLVWEDMWMLLNTFWSKTHHCLTFRLKLVYSIMCILPVKQLNIGSISEGCSYLGNTRMTYWSSRTKVFFQRRFSCWCIWFIIVHSVQSGWSPLLFACAEGHSVLVAKFISLGANIEDYTHEV